MKLLITARELDERGILGKLLVNRGWDLEWAKKRGSLLWYTITDYVFGVAFDETIDHKIIVDALTEELTLTEDEMRTFGFLTDVNIIVHLTLQRSKR